MAYLLTAIMTGGVAAVLSLFEGGTLGQVFLNYVIYGHFGMATLLVATRTARILDRNSDD